MSSLDFEIRHGMEKGPSCGPCLPEHYEISSSTIYNCPQEGDPDEMVTAIRCKKCGGCQVRGLRDVLSMMLDLIRGRK